MTAIQETNNDEYASLAPLFEELADESLPEPRRAGVRDRLVTEHLPLAQHIARKFRNRGQPEDDLVQVATVGLINAVDRFDPTRSTNFLSFAVPTITGEIRRYFRDATWAVRVPRRLKELHAAIVEASTRLGQELGRSPRPSELAADLGISVNEVSEGLQASAAYTAGTLDEPDEGSSGAISTRTSQVDEGMNLVEDRAVLHPALALLSEREASIVVLRFFGNLTQSQIAARVGLSQMHVSRLLAASLSKLRDVIEDEPAPTT